MLTGNPHELRRRLRAFCAGRTALRPLRHWVACQVWDVPTAELAAVRLLFEQHAEGLLTEDAVREGVRKALGTDAAFGKAERSES